MRWDRSPGDSSRDPSGERPAKRRRRSTNLPVVRCVDASYLIVLIAVFASIYYRLYFELPDGKTRRTSVGATLPLDHRPREAAFKRAFEPGASEHNS